MIGRLARIWSARHNPLTPPLSPAFGDPADATDDVILLGQEAQRLVESPVLALAVDRLERTLFNAAMQTSVGDVETREREYRKLWALAAVKQELLVMAGNGKMKAAERERQKGKG